MKGGYLYVFHGYGGENSLRPLAQFMDEQGKETFMVDDQLFPYEREEMVRTLSEKKREYEVIYITSGHLWFDEKNYDFFYWKNPHILSPIEMIDFLEPAFSVYYPHDLECFMHPSEMKWIDLFDLVMLPYRNNDYFHLLGYARRVEVVGWIKMRKKLLSRNLENGEAYSPVFFPSNIISFYHQLGLEGYAEWFSQNISTSIPIKMPASDVKFQQLLMARGYPVLDAGTSVYDAMAEHNLVIASGNSSIVYEAAFSGIPVITLLDGMMPDEVYLKELSGIKGVYPLHPDELNRFLDNTNREHICLESGPNILEPFDFQKVYEWLTEKERTMTASK